MPNPRGLIVSCLTIPHPRLNKLYRVTQTFKARFDSDERKGKIVEFYSPNPEAVSIEGGESCGEQAKPTANP